MDLNFYMPVRVFSGTGCLSAQFDKVAALGRRCLIVTGQHGARESGALDAALQLCRQYKVEATVYPDIPANPLLSRCETAAQAAQTVRAQFVFGIGGGSVLDAAKVIAWLAANRPEDTDGLYARTLRCAPLPCVLVGTTAGTGSEVTAVSVLTVDATGRKKSVTDPRLYARYAFADAAYTASLPREQAVSTALDALCHAAEGMLSPLCEEAPMLFAEKALSLLGHGMPALCGPEPPDAAARQVLLYGSIWAGLVINQTGTAFPHPMGYILTEQYGVPHGMASAVFLPALLRRAGAFTPMRLMRLYRAFGGGDALADVLEALVRCDVRMTPEQIEAQRERLTGCKHYARTPGGFDERLALQTLYEVCGPEAER